MLAQKDNKLNIQMALDSRSLAVSSKKNTDVNLDLARWLVLIARAAKRDSQFMKSIAVLTMVFLPGTFVTVSASSFTQKTLQGRANHG